MMQFPIDGDRHYLKHRKDVIDNPEYQKKYKADTGKELRCPEPGKSTARWRPTLTVGIGIMTES